MRDDEAELDVAELAAWDDYMTRASVGVERRPLLRPAIPAIRAIRMTGASFRVEGRLLLRPAIRAIRSVMAPAVTARVALLIALTVLLAVAVAYDAHRHNHYSTGVNDCRIATDPWVKALDDCL
jgi:hypothetical protein